MDSKKKAAVVIPIYKTELSAFEKISLMQCQKVLSNHPIIAVAPEGLDLSELGAGSNFSQIITFDKTFFQGVQGYNSLMLSANFYEKLNDFEFILIYQLDAFVFSDSLLLWCNSGYDYIGAPWPKRLAEPDIIKATKTKLITFYHQWRNTIEDGLPSQRQFDNQVGNGGFSLRRVEKFFGLASRMQEKINEYHLRTEHQFHEDVFWSIEVNRKLRRLKIPSFKTAYKFSIENNPERGVKFNGGKLPFGCHSWDHHLDFWKPYLTDLGYKV
ncbi:DUF5672 family protein [Dyadobacter arcticus]|uniref:DUF5672 domain-containing protein n=1 Tax=Dyadobacter arcticus TaxID=1078754 RepID=A0ABX0URL6_9BACT|nr:DUF5672 family protein [Dyadobacter arcticus]NIJ54360.1 hypothetical protein [Dyadobacter arcticus]